MFNNEDWFYIKNAEEVDSPSLLIYVDRVKENIKALINHVDGKVERLRPHVKTHKSKEVAELLLKAGITKFKCATIAEAEMLAFANAPDVLLAYQPYGPKIKRFIELIKAYPATKFSCLIDNIDTAKNIASIAAGSNLQIPVYIDVNVGMNRTGITAGRETIELYEQASKLEGLVLMGLQVYDGHIRTVDFEERCKESNGAFEKVEEIRSQLSSKGFDELVIVAGGSPTFPVHAKRAEVECSPGTFIYWDSGYCAYTEQNFVPAALVLSRIVSLPAGKVCIDLGHKSIASENALHNRVTFLNAPDLIFVGHSEEHLVAEAPLGHSYKVGDILYGLPYHICPTVALYGTALTVQDNEVTGEWKITARERKITV